MNDVFLFDLDGTLLPLDEEDFKQLYFSELKKVFIDLGMDGDLALHSLMKGLDAMWRNTGKKTNEDLFWDVFAKDMPHSHSNQVLKERFIQFYENDFDVAKPSAKQSPYAKKIINLLKAHDKKIVLATNPVFPVVAVKKRLEWAGLDYDMFDFVTTYEGSSFCKPKHAYYQEILDAIDEEPGRCLMIGNDVREDMIAKEMGMDTYLVTECLKNPDNRSIEEFDKGSLKSFYEKMSEVIA